MRKIICAILLLQVLLMSGCEAGIDTSPKYPTLVYRNSAYNFDPYNREIAVPDGFILDEGYSYDTVQTDKGYDIILHFTEDERMDGENDEE